MSAKTNPIRILTVDDHPLLREGIAALVSTQSDMKPVAEASNGREAIQLFRTMRPDVTLMDVQMPEIDGIEALIAIRSEFPDARVIVLTTYSGDVQAMRALKAGAQAYLLKGLLRQELLETIRRCGSVERPASDARIEDQSAEYRQATVQVDVASRLAKKWFCHERRNGCRREPEFSREVVITRRGRQPRAAGRDRTRR